MECLQTLQGHTGSVLCLQYDERVVVTGSSDSTIRLVGNTHVRIHKSFQDLGGCFVMPSLHEGLCMYMYVHILCDTGE